MIMLLTALALAAVTVYYNNNTTVYLHSMAVQRMAVTTTLSTCTVWLYGWMASGRKFHALPSELKKCVLSNEEPQLCHSWVLNAWLTM